MTNLWNEEYFTDHVTSINDILRLFHLLLSSTLYLFLSTPHYPKSKGIRHGLKIMQRLKNKRRNKQTTNLEVYVRKPYRFTWQNKHNNKETIWTCEIKKKWNKTAQMTHIIYTNWQQRSSLANKPKTKQVCNIFFSATCQIVCGQIMSHHHIPLRLSQLSLSSRHHLFLSTLQFTSRISQKV